MKPHRFHASILTLSFFLFFACEKIPLSQEEKSSPTDQDLKQVTDLAPPEIESKTDLSESEYTKKESPLEPKKAKGEPLPVVIHEMDSQPEEPQFSSELLAVVKNWTKIPKSVFPARPILASTSVELIAKSSSGLVIATSNASAGSELQVLGMKGNTLIVANANNSKLRGEVDIDLTDFKQLLAYRFELNQKKKEERLLNQQDPKTKKNPVQISKPILKRSSPKVEIPDPLDFGHGRFCICKDCRDKRLAKTGSLKTGFGLEP